MIANDNALIFIILLLLLLVGIGLKQGLSIATEQQVSGPIKPKELTPTHDLPKVTWDDFQGEPNYELEFLSLSFWKVTYSYTIVFSGGKIKILMNAQCVLEKDKSWVKPEFKSPELLEHEQGHFYIGSLCALTFKKRVREAEFNKTNYRAEIERMFEKTLSEFLKVEEKYDWDTDHFINPEEQGKWNKDLIGQINALSDYWWF